MPDKSLIRVIYSPHRPEHQNAGRKPTFVMTSEDGIELGIGWSPYGQAARALIEMGYDPERPYTTRLANRDYDSFTPCPLGEAAQKTVSEGNNNIKAIKWAPHPNFRNGSDPDLANESDDSEIGPN